jgi:hypothetical protein
VSTWTLARTSTGDRPSNGANTGISVFSPRARATDRPCARRGRAAGDREHHRRAGAHQRPGGRLSGEAAVDLDQVAAVRHREHRWTAGRGAARLVLAMTLQGDRQGQVVESTR